MTNSIQSAIKNIRNIPWYTVLIIGVLLLLGYVAASVVRTVNSPDGAILLNTSEASWIAVDTSYALGTHLQDTQYDYFSHEFLLTDVPDTADFHIRAFRGFVLRVNEHQIAAPERSSNSGVNTETIIDISTYLQPGNNRVLIGVSNVAGPTAVLAYSPAIGLRTDLSWFSGNDIEATRGGVRQLAEKPSHLLNNRLNNTGEVFTSSVLYVIALFVVGFVGTILFRNMNSAHKNKFLSLNAVHWLFIASWIVLCVNNFFKLPSYIGFDVHGHEEYVLHILKHGELPVASDGWQMFQAPLFYLLSAPIYSVIENGFGDQYALYALRILPMICGLVILEMSYRSSILVFNKRLDLQFVSFCIGANIPMTYYITQTTGNEPLLGALTSILIYICLRYLIVPPVRITYRPAIIIGMIFGAAILTKVSVVLLLPVLFGVYWYLYVERNVSDWYAIKSGMVFIASSCLVSGWYFARNFMVFGKPFVGGWDDVRGILWWQDPGYRMLSDVFHFGDSLFRPAYSSIHGFWDGVYSTLWLDGFLSSIISIRGIPPWNYPFMLSLSWLALPLTLALLAGILMSFRQSSEANVMKIAAASVVSYLLGMLYLYFQLPIYSTVKSTYALGLVPCLGLLAAYGVSRLMHYPLLRAVIGGYLTTWIGFVYVSFFIV